MLKKRPNTKGIIKNTEDLTLYKTKNVFFVNILNVTTTLYQLMFYIFKIFVALITIKPERVITFPPSICVIYNETP